MPRFTDADDVSWGFTPAERTRTRAAIAELQSIRARRAKLDAREAELLAGVTGIALDQISRDPNGSDYAFPIRSMAVELALALKESPRAMQGRMDRAWQLVERFPVTHAALAEGRITDRHAREIVAAGADISRPEARVAYETEIAALAEHATPHRIKDTAKQVAERHQPTTLAERHERARADRRTFVEDLPDGMAMLGVIGPAPAVHGAHDHLTQTAQAVKRDRRAVTRELDGIEPAPDDPAYAKYTDDRHLAQLRADIALDLLLTGEPTGHDLDRAVTATIEITIPVTTLVGLDDGPALLAGYGPIDPDTARRLAADATGWERVFLHPDTGALLTVDHYTPSAAQRRHLLARDRTCRVPGCTTRAKHCDIDHTIPYSRGGPTDVGNLAALCEPHHTMKHHSPWRFRHLGHGRLRFTSPAGYDYIDSPPMIFTGGPPAPF
ncbi:HNH endonuclease signature motif containing protein [Microbacterium rhizophilus]|uniref:HNH endonuclease signature motif containing protein n=1 Tax=Microbacterium rhizophilus TaxID=3138934 RepID=UPI0031E586F9